MPVYVRERGMTFRAVAYSKVMLRGKNEKNAVEYMKRFAIAATRKRRPKAIHCWKRLTVKGKGNC
jgi:hypothetical protein